LVSIICGVETIVDICNWVINKFRKKLKNNRVQNETEMIRFPALGHTTNT
jgi:hypothetical protein